MKQVPACMARVLPLVLAAWLGTTGLGLGCKAKPSEKACREAIENIRRISEQSTADVGADPIAAIRSCRGNSSKAAVECWRAAKTLEDLEKCEGETGGLPGVAAEPKQDTLAPADAAAAAAAPSDAAAVAAPAIDAAAAKEDATAAAAETADGETGKVEPAKSEPASAKPPKAEPTQ